MENMFFYLEGIPADVVMTEGDGTVGQAVTMVIDMLDSSLCNLAFHYDLEQCDEDSGNARMEYLGDNLADFRAW